MSERELVMLGTASQAPTRHRNHNAYVLRWDGHSVLFDPGEGVQRQFTLAGLSAASVSRICISHFHGDHCLGLPGMIMRLSMDEGRLPVPIHYPGAGEEFFRRLRFATPGQEMVAVDARPITGPGVVASDEICTVRCARLSHRVEAFGYRVEEPDRRHLIPERLAQFGIVGADIGRIRDEGSLVHGGRTIGLDEVSERRPGQVFAFIMDTAWCDGALELADGADLVLCESTFLSCDEAMAEEYGHLTAQQAGRLAREAGARRLVLSHFSRRYGDDAEAFGTEARHEFDDVVVGADFLKVPVPPRR